MKQIKIVEANREAIKAALKEAQGKATVNTINASHVLEFAKRGEEGLEAIMLPQNLRAGACYLYRDPGPSANAYKYSQGATQIVIRRRSSAWYLESIERVSVWPKQRTLAELRVSPEQKEEAVKRFQQSICVDYHDTATPEGQANYLRSHITNDEPAATAQVVRL